MNRHPIFTATRTWPDSVWHTDMPFPESVVITGEQRGEMVCRGPWSLISQYKALAMEQLEDSRDTSHYDAGTPYRTKAVLYGIRSLSHPRESGYCLEGTVSVNGQDHRAFTSSAMFEVNGKLVDVAILYVCRKDKE